MGAAGDVTALITAARGGDPRATGRLISIVEDDAVAAIPVLQAIYPASHGAWLTGITGAPGAGKSTLADRLISRWVDEGRRVAVLAVDPTSPFTGGALLGDRIRMQRGAASPGVLVRSMATRGWLGGLARATERVATLCAGLGYDEVLIETVGVGQSEVDVAAAADTTVLVLAAGWGDGVQVAKAGVMEIGDVFVVNKADRADAAAAAAEIREMLQLAATGDGWQPAVVSTVATTGEGVTDLVAALSDHRSALGRSGSSDRATGRRLRDLQRALTDEMEARVLAQLDTPEGKRARAAVAAGDLDPWSAAAELSCR